MSRLHRRRRRQRRRIARAAWLTVAMVLTAGLGALIGAVA